MRPASWTEERIDQLTHDQAGVLSRAQVLAAGRTVGWIRAQLAARRWRRVHSGVYATFTGPLPRAAQLWAAVLACGPGAVLCRSTALEADGAGERSSAIEVRVPSLRRVRPPAGISVTYSAAVTAHQHPAARPPRTRTEESVLDVVHSSRRPTDVVDVLIRACQRRRTTAARLLEAAERRKKLRWRTLIAEILADVAEGAESPLERRYLREVERRHRLPRGRRQHRTRSALRSHWRDVRYDEFAVVVELDGAATRPQEVAFRDYLRDNVAALRRETALRYGWRDVAGNPCMIAAQVDRLLRDKGWAGPARACGPGCAVRRATPGCHDPEDLGSWSDTSLTGS